MSRWGALPTRGAIFSNRDSIFLSLLFDATCLMSVSCLFWHLLSVRTLLCPCGRLHDPGAPGIGRQVVGWQTKRWGGRFFRWGGTCHPISIQSYAPAKHTPNLNAIGPVVVQLSRVACLRHPLHGTCHVPWRHRWVSVSVKYEIY